MKGNMNNKFAIFWNRLTKILGQLILLGAVAYFIAAFVGIWVSFSNEIARYVIQTSIYLVIAFIVFGLVNVLFVRTKEKEAVVVSSEGRNTVLRVDGKRYLVGAPKVVANSVNLEYPIFDMEADDYENPFTTIRASHKDLHKEALAATLRQQQLLAKTK